MLRISSTRLGLHARYATGTLYAAALFHTVGNENTVHDILPTEGIQVTVDYVRKILTITVIYIGIDYIDVMVE